MLGEADQQDRTYCYRNQSDDGVVLNGDTGERTDIHPAEV